MIRSPVTEPYVVKYNASNTEGRVLILKKVTEDYHKALVNMENENIELKKELKKALKENKKLARYGRLLKESHDSLSTKYTTLSKQQGIKTL